MIPEAFREGRIEDPDEYNRIRDGALTYAHTPPPTDADIAQFREAYADKNEAYIDTQAGANPIHRALIFWSDSLYTAKQLRAIVPDIIPSYNEFDGRETIKLLTRLYPNAWFIPAREYSVATYVVNKKNRPLKKPSADQQVRLKVDSCDYYPAALDGSEMLTDVIRMWWR